MPTSKPHEHEPSLESALTPTQRHALLRLLDTTTHSMRQQMGHTAGESAETTSLRTAAVGSFTSWANPLRARISSVLGAAEPFSTSEDEAGLAEHGDLILSSLLLLVLSTERYDARSRVLLTRLCAELGVSVQKLAELEASTAASLLAAARHMSAEAETASRADAARAGRKWKWGIASVAGAALIGVTGGLAAPLVAAGLSTVLGTVGLGATAAAGYLGALAGSGALVGTLFGAYGGRMTGRMVEKYAAEVKDFSFVPVGGAEEEGEEGRRLRVAVGVTGWVVDAQEDVVAPWRCLGGHGVEAYALRWEVEAQQELGNALRTMLGAYVYGKVKGEIIKRTVFATLYSALWPLGLMKAAKLVDNPFSIAMRRSEKAGLVLADAIVNRAQGERPVTLVGFSLGARVVYTCLLELAERGAFGLVENVVLMGSPVPATKSAWERIRMVVSGRVVNVFSEQDYVLAFLYRTSSIQLGVAGLQKIEVTGVENVDAGETVAGHLRYRFAVGGLLKDLLEGDIEVDEAAKQQDVLKILETEDEKKGDEKWDEVEEGRRIVAEKEKQ